MQSVRNRVTKFFGFLGLADETAIEVDYEIGYFELYTKMIEYHATTQPMGGTSGYNGIYLREGFDRAARLIKFSELTQQNSWGAIDKDEQKR